MSNLGLECAGSCLQRCSEYQRGEARQGTPPPRRTDPTGRAPATAALAPNPGGLRNPRPRAPTPASLSPGMGMDPGISPFPLLCQALPALEQGAASPCSTQITPDGRNAAFYSILKPAGRTD